MLDVFLEGYILSLNLSVYPSVRQKHMEKYKFTNTYFDVLL